MMQKSITSGERKILSPFLWLFVLVGIVLSVFLVEEETSKKMFETGSAAMLQTGNFDNRSFFLQVLFSRLSFMVVFIVLATTSLQKVVLLLQPILFFIGIGGWIGAAVSQFGIKGLLLITAGAFPHLLLYVCVIYFLIKLLWARMYYDKQFFIAVFILFFLMIIGCILESYVNPVVVAKILKIF